MEATVARMPAMREDTRTIEVKKTLARDLLKAATVAAVGEAVAMAVRAAVAAILAA